ILAEGGNAVEAMVAMAATIVAVYPHMNHIGGDGFWLIREPLGRVRALMAAGPAGANARIALYREHGYDEIPPRGPLAALTVPGAVAGGMLGLGAAHALGGTVPRPPRGGVCARGPAPRLGRQPPPRSSAPPRDPVGTRRLAGAPQPGPPL